MRALLAPCALFALLAAAPSRAQDAGAAPNPRVQSARIALGKILFFDRRLSRDKTISCASCHSPNKGWADDQPLSKGVGGKRGRRNALSLLNASSHNLFMWDGRATGLEAQVELPLSDPDEMDSSAKKAEKTVAAIPGYAPYFKAAYGDSAATFPRIAKAIVSFERTLVSTQTAYARFNTGDVNALSDAERRGLELFRGKANCFLCHRLQGESDKDDFHNIGIGFDLKPRDLGAYAVTEEEGDRFAFRVPDLRNLKYTAPYMHDGSLKTLEDVVDYYDKGGNDDPDLEFKIMPLHLSAAEKADLVAFLGALNGDPLVMNPPAKFPSSSRSASP